MTVTTLVLVAKSPWMDCCQTDATAKPEESKCISKTVSTLQCLQVMWIHISATINSSIQCAWDPNKPMLDMQAYLNHDSMYFQLPPFYLKGPHYLGNQYHLSSFLSSFKGKLPKKNVGTSSSSSKDVTIKQTLTNSSSTCNHVFWRNYPSSKVKMQFEFSAKCNSR